MMRKAALAAVLAVCSWYAPASAAAGASGETCALDVREDPSGTLAPPNTYWGTIDIGPVTGSDSTNPANVVSVAATCRITVNGAVVVTAQASGTPTAASTWQIAYTAQPGDVVELCTTWELFDSTGSSRHEWDASSNAFTMSWPYTCEPVVAGTQLFYNTHTVAAEDASV